MMGKMEIRSPPGNRPRDGRHCDLCGCSQPAVRCDKCGCQIFCLSCDDMYHRHPKRRFHLRKAVDPIPSVPQARPVLPMKVSHLNATNPGDPSKMPLPPPRKKKSLFSSFRKPSPSSEHSPPLPKKEYSWTDRLGSIKKFMSNRPLPPLPNSDDFDTDSQPATNGQVQRGDLSFIHKRTDERPPQLPERSPRSPNFPGYSQEKENRIPGAPIQFQGQIRNGSFESNGNHMNQNHESNSNDPNHWNHLVNHQNDTQAFGTLNRQRPFIPPGAPGYPGGMHQSSSATDLHNLHNADGMHGPVPPHYPQHYPMNPHMPPHYPYPMYPGYPNYPQYFGSSFANLSNPPTSEGDFSDSEPTSRHPSKRQSFRKRAKRSQSVMMDRMAYPGQFFPFGPYPGYGPWGAPVPMETPPSPASSMRSLNRTGRTRRRKKGTSEDDDEEFSETSSPMSRPKSSSSDPKEHPRAPLATQTTSSEDESDDNANKRRNKINTIKRQIEPIRSPSPSINNKTVTKLKKNSSKQSDSDTQECAAVRNDRPPLDTITEQRQPVPQSPAQQQCNIQRSSTPQQPILRESPVAQPVPIQPQTSNSITTAPSEIWECRHCTFANPIGNRICQVCCKTATPRTATPISSQSRPSSSSAKHRKESVGSENEYFVPEENNEIEANKKEKQDMASLNFALDEAEKQISKGLEELMKLKDDIDSNTSNEKVKPSEVESKTDNEDKPVYKSSGRMRTSILDKLNLNKSQASNSSVSTSTETQTDRNNRTIDKIIEARRLSNSSSASDTYNSPLAQSPELGYLGNKQKRDSSCQTQQDSITEYLEKRKAAEEAFLGRSVNNFGFGYGDRMDMVTSPVPSMYDRFYGGGYGMMQRSHSRASLFTGRMNDFAPMDYGPGFGFGPAPMYRSVSRGSLTGDYPDGRISEFHNLRKPEYYLSMEELVERRRQDNIRAQGLELVRMIREAEQQGFNADDIQVALTHCSKQNPMEWLQENWRNMVDSVVTLSTNYGSDKKENDIGLLSENEARDALRLHKGNIWAAVTECVEGRQRKYLELSARGNFSRQDIVDSLTSSEGDVEMAYAKLTKSTGKPFLMRIWGQGEGVQNQDGAQPMSEDFLGGSRRYLKDDTLNHDELSDDLWSEDEDAVDWDDEEDYDEERGDIEDLLTCHEDLPASAQEIRTPESEKSEYCDAFPVDDRNASSPSDDVFFVIPEAKPEKKKGFLSKLVALRRDNKEHAETTGKGVDQQDPQANEDSTLQKIIISSEQKNGGALNTLKNTFSAIKDTVTGGVKNDKKAPSAQLDRRTIIVKGQVEHEPISTDFENETKSSPIHNSLQEDSFKISKSNEQHKEQIKCVEDLPTKVATISTKTDNDKTLITNLPESNLIKADKNNAETQSNQADSKKAEKSSQSLAERLKFSKHTHSLVDTPGPSGINKESFKQTFTPMQFQKNVNIISEIIPKQETNSEQKNVNKIPNFQNIEKSESKDENTHLNMTDQQIDENIVHEKKIPSSSFQSTQVLEMSSQDLSKQFNVATATESSKTDNLTKLNILQTKEANSSKTHSEPATNKKCSAKIQFQSNTKKFVESSTAIAKIIECDPNSALVSKKDYDNAQISEITKEDTSKTDGFDNSSTVANNAPSELKVTDCQKEKSETKVGHSRVFLPEVSNSENKTSIVNEKDEKGKNNIESAVPKAINEKTESLKGNNMSQIIVNKTDNIETSSKISELPNVCENSKNLRSVGNEKSLERLQDSFIEENKTKVKVSTVTESLITESNENISKDIDPTQTASRENLITNEIVETATSVEILKSHEIPKASTSQETLKSISGDSKQQNSVLINDKQILIGSNATKTEKDPSIIDISKQDIQGDLAQLETLPEYKSNTQENETSTDLSVTSSDVYQRNLTMEVIINNNSNQNIKLESDTLKAKTNMDGDSSEHLISNQTSADQNLGIVIKENASTSIQHLEDLPRAIMQEIEAVQIKNTDNTPIQTQINVPENLHDQAEIEKAVKDITSLIPFENNKDSAANNTAEASELPKKHEVECSNKTKNGVAKNSVSSINTLSNSLPDNKNNIEGKDNSLKNKVETLSKNINEPNINEIPGDKIILNENELPDAVNSSNKEMDYVLKSSENESQTSLEENKFHTTNTVLEITPSTSTDTIQNTALSTESQNLPTPSATLLKSKEDEITVNVLENVKKQENELASNLPKEIDISSSEIINKESSSKAELRAPVFSKEYPNKNIFEVPESARLPESGEATTISPANNESVKSESLLINSNTNISDNLQISENASSINNSDSNKTVKTSLKTNDLNNVASSTKNLSNSSEIIDNHDNVSDSSKPVLTDNITNSSVIKDNVLSDNISTEQMFSVTNTDTISIPNTSSSPINTSNDSITEKSTNIAISDTTTALTSSNASISDNSKVVTSVANKTAAGNTEIKGISTLEHPKLSADATALSKDNKYPASKPNEQHSNVPETDAASSSTSIAKSHSAHAVSSIQSKKLQRSVSDDRKETDSSESDDVDIEYSDNSRRGSLLPSAIDTLRSRFEGFASETTVRGGPIRPASPFRRMSFNSRKQVIALERKRDTSTEKPWFHKVHPEPVKIIQPKRSVRQQLEMERKVRKMVADRKCRTYKKAEIVVQLMDMNFEEEEAIQAANECATLEQAISFLQQECLLCTGYFPVSQIISMTHCEHRACRECIRAYFTVQIRDRTILDLLCPFCNEPDIGDEDIAQDYFNHLDIMLKKLVDIEIHELFQRKLRDRVLMKDPNFRWCSQCSSGFIAMPNLKRLICPDCNAVTCASCRRLWEKEHQGMSCEAFAALKDATDPEAQAAGLAKLLTEDGISCPSCHFRYALAKGGCMHFRCIQCQHDFCSGCSRPFKMGQKCGVSEFCTKLGLHAHHPRNCLFYLRDKEPEDLQKLLDLSDVSYNREPPEGMELKTTCQVMEQKETADGMVDDYCGKEIQDGYAGLCRIHYVEYLGQLVNKNKVDPIQIFDNDDLELVLKRANIRLPPKRYRENEWQYREKLVKVIQEELPLDRMDGS